MDLLLIANLVVLMYIWFDTEAFVEWSRLFKLKFFKYHEYFLAKQSPVPFIACQTYPDFLAQTYGPKSFSIRLITCPICLGVWLNFIGSCLRNYGTFLFLGFNILATWILYHSVKWLLRKLNE